MRAFRAVATHLAIAASLLAGTLSAQVAACPPGTEWKAFLGWQSTDCGQCNVYGDYLEYLREPRIRDIRPGGPADGKLRENDTLVSVDDKAITSPHAWQRIREAEPGDTLTFKVRHDGEHSLAEAAIVVGARCGPRRLPRTGEGGALRLLVPRPRAGSRDPRPPISRYGVAGALVEVQGEPDSVSFDRETGELLVRVRGVTVRVRPRPF